MYDMHLYLCEVKVRSIKVKANYLKCTAIAMTTPLIVYLLSIRQYTPHRTRALDIESQLPYRKIRCGEVLQ